MKLNYDILAKYGFECEENPEDEDITDTMTYRDGSITLVAKHIGKGEYEITSVQDRNLEWYEDPANRIRFEQLFRLGSLERIFEELEAPISIHASRRYSLEQETPEDRIARFSRQDTNLRKEPWREAA